MSDSFQEAWQHESGHALEFLASRLGSVHFRIPEAIQVPARLANPPLEHEHWPTLQHGMRYWIFDTLDERWDGHVAGLGSPSETKQRESRRKFPDLERRKTL